MRALLLNTYDWGGAGTATSRLHRGLRRIGIDARMLVAHKRGDDPEVYAPESMPRRAAALGRIVLDSAPLKAYGGADADFSLGWLPDGLAGRVSAHDPDVVHLNWVGEGFLNVKTLRRFDVPVVWRLPDMWAFTGGCHYADGCDRFTEACGTCPRLGTNRVRDPSWWIHRRKRRSWRDVDLTVVAPSTWLAEQAARSSLFEDRRIEVIPNGLDTEVFRPYDRELAREVFDLPMNRDVILFGSVSPTADERKGFEYLRDALQSLAVDIASDEVRVVVFGASEPSEPPDLGFDVDYVGYLHDEESLALLYAAADVMVVPSTYEGFGQTVTEAMACGTPVVAFDATGPSDTIVHEETGYLAEPYDATDLHRGLEWILEDADRRTRLGTSARARAVEEYDIESVAGWYRALYEELLD